MLPSRPLGQFFTPPQVVDLAFAVLAWLRPDVRAGRLVDLSCGEGAFLAGALRHGFAAERVYGLDVDPQLLPGWQALFPPPARPHLALADGLLGPMTEAFEVVVGNPPFGGSPDPAVLPHLMGVYRWWRLGRRGGGSFPRELWFLERSLRLLRPGGLLGLVLPEGFLANKRWRPQREELLRRAQMEAVIGLPRSVFRHSRAAVKTCLIFVRQQAPAAGHVVRLAELDDEDLPCPEALLEAWKAGAVHATEAPWQKA